MKDDIARAKFKVADLKYVWIGLVIWLLGAALVVLIAFL